MERRDSPKSNPNIFKSSNLIQIMPEFIDFPKSHKIDASSIAPIPHKEIHSLDSTIISAYTGPEAGITWEEDKVKKSKAPTEHSGIHWGQRWNQNAYGVAVSLYEEDLTRGKTMGDPVADVFGIVRRKNCSFMALADGCGWGEKPRLAARCAVRAALDHLDQRLYDMKTTHKVCRILLDAMFEAQNLIIEKEATLTTLVITVVCPIRTESKKCEWAAISLSVGDSSSFVYDPNTKTIRSLQVRSERMGVVDCGGCLGPQVGIDPELENLVLSYSKVQPDDIVFLVSDGVTDNFDVEFNSKAEPLNMEDKPTYGKLIKTLFLKNTKSPTREEKSRQKMSEVVKEYFAKQEGIVSTAQELCVSMINYVLSATQEKRGFHESAQKKNFTSKHDIRERDPELYKMMSTATGKLDHASIVACCVGENVML